MRAAGLCQDTASLDSDTRAALAIEDVRDARLGAGPGNVRILLFAPDNSVTLRDAIQRIARRLASRAPHVLWIIGASECGGGAAAIAALAPDAGPRLASFVWEPSRVVDSDAEALCALAALRVDDDVLYHARCTEVLGRDALTRRFYRTLETRVSAIARSAPAQVARQDARSAAVLLTSRLLFLQFLEAKGWMDADRLFLSNRFDACMRSGGAFHRRVLQPLFFGTLNTPVRRRARLARALGRVPFLNGGLFARTALERRVRWQVPDDEIGALFDQLFARYRFVAREDSATWSEASVDPEMLGRAFESLMAASERKSDGVYYTPHALVTRVTEHALQLADAHSLPVLSRLRVLDPACGSGAFLVNALERIAESRLAAGEPGTRSGIRRSVLATSIFGVDRNPTAVWLCELRLWLSVVIESDEPDPMLVAPLPNLDRNVRVGDALAGPPFASDMAAVIGSAKLEKLRGSYVRATGKRKQHLDVVLDREERRRVLAHADREIVATQHARRETLAALRARDLFGQRLPPAPEHRRALRALRDRLRALRGDRRRIMDGGALPFSFHAFFASAQSQGGFDVIIGTPPWVRLHRIPAAVRVKFRQSFEVFRCAAWQVGAESAGVATGFASQVDLAALFVERAVQLLRPGGVASLLVPSKLWRSLAGGGVRSLLARTTTLARLEDLGDARRAFDAAVYPSLVVAQAGSPPPDAPMQLAVHDGSAVREWSSTFARVPFDETRGAPWLILPPDARRAFDRVRDSGAPLAESHFGAPRLGVKSGCNAAFIVRVQDAARGIATVTNADGETGSVELSMLRPALRGDAVIPWTRRPCDEWILWTHDDAGAPLAELPDRSRAWLRRHYATLAARSDAARARRWWALFRVDAADCSTPRVMWADFGRRPRAAVLPAGDPTVPLNTCYVIRCRDDSDAWALAALLNSPVTAAWLNCIAEPARGGYRRYLGWTVGLLPVPADWDVARSILAAAAHATDDELIDATLRAWQLSRAVIAPLLRWADSS